MPAPQLITYSDAVESMQDFLQGMNVAAHQQVIRRAIQVAYREIVTARDWRCMIRNGRVQLQAPQSTGTIAYDNDTRTLTLSGATLPSWAINGAVCINNVLSDIESVESSTSCTLDATLNPGKDIDTGTSYTLFPRWYILPSDFVSLAGTLNEQIWAAGQYISPAELFTMQRNDQSFGVPRWYTVAQAPDLYGSMALFIHPASDVTETLDFPYVSRPRNLRYSGQDAIDSAGTITVTAGTATVTGDSTQFTADHVGSIIRISGNATKPTGVIGGNPYVEERAIAAYTSATEITLDAAVAASRDAVKYVISDPIDLDISLQDAFMRCAEKQLAISRNLESRNQIILAAEAALFQAKCADGRSIQRGRVGGGPPQRLRLRDVGYIGDTIE